MATHLITGAGSGIGAAVARRLGERGDELVLLARSEPRGEELVAQFPGARAVVADLEDPARTGDAVRRQDLPERLDSVVHAAGVVELGPVGEMSPALWAQTMNVNLLAPAELTRVVLPALRAARGQVLFVNSGSGLRSKAGWAAYAASKHALRALADALREEEAGHGVRVSSIYPGRVATAMQEKVHVQEGKDYDPSAFIDPESVAAAVLTALDTPRDAELTDLSLRPTPRP